MSTANHTPDYSLGKFLHALQTGQIPDLVMPVGMKGKLARRLPVVASQDLSAELVWETYLAQIERFELARFACLIGRDNAQTDALKRQRQLQEYYQMARGWPTMAGMGSHRNSAVNAAVKELIEHIANYAVHAGIGLTHGHFYMGFMRWFREYWLRARSRYPSGRVFVGGVPLWVEGVDMSWDSRNPPDHWHRYGLDDGVSPPHATLETRFPAIIGPSENICSLYGAGGRGMREELARDLLLMQHAYKSITAYSRRPAGCFPLCVLLDFQLQSGKWYWDSTVDQHIADREIDSISEDDCKNIIVIRVSKEKKPKVPKGCPIEVKYFPSAVLAGKYVVERALEQYVLLGKGYAAQLSSMFECNSAPASAKTRKSSRTATRRTSA